MTVKQYLLGVRNIDMRIKALAEYPQEQQKFLDFKATASEQIHGMRDNRHMALLEYRYLKGMTWGEVTDELGYHDADYVRRCLHMASLKEFESENPNFQNYYPLKK